MRIGTSQERLAPVVRQVELETNHQQLCIAQIQIRHRNVLVLFNILSTKYVYDQKLASRVESVDLQKMDGSRVRVSVYRESVDLTADFLAVRGGVD